MEFHQTLCVRYGSSKFLLIKRTRLTQFSANKINVKYLRTVTSENCIDHNQSEQNKLHSIELTLQGTFKNGQAINIKCGRSPKIPLH